MYAIGRDGNQSGVPDAWDGQGAVQPQAVPARREDLLQVCQQYERDPSPVTRHDPALDASGTPALSGEPNPAWLASEAAQFDAWGRWLWLVAELVPTGEHMSNLRGRGPRALTCNAGVTGRCAWAMRGPNGLPARHSLCWRPDSSRRFSCCSFLGEPLCIVPAMVGDNDMRSSWQAAEGAVVKGGTCCWMLFVERWG